MERDTHTGKLMMRDLNDIMDKGVSISQIPFNLLHLWQVTTRDVGLEEKFLSGRRIHLCFGLKHKNDGKMKSHLWHYRGIC